MELGECAPPVKESESSKDYFSRTQDYWTEQAQTVAQREGITAKPKQILKAAQRMAHEFFDKS